MRSELIISTYNTPIALNLVLCALRLQTELPDSIAIADDGSGQPTCDVIEKHQKFLPIRHAWHPDNGFAKNEILNKTIASSDAEYLIFIDGDCVASQGFVERHLTLVHPDRFATGSVIRLSQTTTDDLSEDDITSGNLFAPTWLAKKGETIALSRKLKAGHLGPWSAAVLDRLSPIRKTWSGGNASTFRKNLITVNGFDESMRYGGEDKELGARLLNAGIKGQFLRYSAPLMHLHHARGYVDPEVVKQNRAKIDDTRKTRRTWADLGLDRHL